MRFYRNRDYGYRDVRFGYDEKYLASLENLQARTLKGIKLLEEAVKNYKISKELLKRAQYEDSAKFAKRAANSINDAFHYIPQSDKDMSTWIKLLAQDN
ncbi:MAG: hypothetical protein IJF84_13255 [Thermoguttaceae bacterium]|nr:hypothetical protein [Thermoguttaceae bacterium]